MCARVVVDVVNVPELIHSLLPTERQGVAALVPDTNGASGLGVLLSVRGEWVSH